MGKTELILFGTKRKLKIWQDYSIECQGQTINATTSVKYLGLTIDQYMNGEELGLSIIKRCNSRLKFLDKLGFLRIVYVLLLSFVCLFHYSISTWYCGVTTQMSKQLQIGQNKMIRFILNKDYIYHLTVVDFKDLNNILTIQNRAIQLRLNHVFNICNDYWTRLPYIKFLVCTFIL